MYMPNVSPNASRPNATYIPLTCVLGCRVGDNANFSVRVGGNANFSFLDTNMMVFENFALGVQANARTQRECFCVAAEYRLKYYLLDLFSTITII